MDKEYAVTYSAGDKSEKVTTYVMAVNISAAIESAESQMNLTWPDWLHNLYEVTSVTRTSVAEWGKRVPVSTVFRDLTR